MDRRHKKDNARPEAATAGARSVSAARFARQEVADVLAEGLWSLICAGRRPGGEGNGAPPAAAAAVWPGGPHVPQAVETTWV
jgi:hypothetical protein